MMRTITTVTNIYTIDELAGVNRQTALESVAREREETWMEFDSHELVESAKKAAEYYGARVVNWSIGLFSNSSVQVDLDGLELEDARLLATSINDMTEDGSAGTCPFTGTHFDCYFFDYFKEAGPTNPRAVRRDIGKAIFHMVRKAVQDEEESILSEATNKEYAEDMELEFLEDGTIYYG